ncbi:MAG: sensor domain-containing protein [Anaerolineales bacterium]|nr:sensor domain-containing protein [Anaerolineales bacterium]
MYTTIDEYLAALKTAMKDADPALVQDALADAQEHLTLALATAREAQPGADPAAVLPRLIGEYGSPEETAAAYAIVERRTTPALRPAAQPRSWLGRFFGVYTDPRAWGALLYMLISLMTGLFYFTWAVTGLSLALTTLIFIFGFPLALLFLLSVRGLALVEGRLVEALLGVRMPRRPLLADPSLKWQARLQRLVTDRATWLALGYLLLQLVLGVVYFSIVVIAVTLALGVIAAPFLQYFLNLPIMTMGDARVFLPYWALALLALGGLGVLTGTLHLARGIGQLHGKLAKAMLVSD